MLSRWVALYNANLDRSVALRKRLAELRLEMRRWEEDRRASRKDPLKIDLAEYRVRVPLSARLLCSSPIPSVRTRPNLIDWYCVLRRIPGKNHRGERVGNRRTQTRKGLLKQVEPRLIRFW